MGRHSSAKARSSRARTPIIVLVLVVVLGLGGWFGFDFVRDQLRAASCATTDEVYLTAAPDIAPVISGIAAQLPEDDCYKVKVTTRSSDSTAQSLVVSDGTRRPDVWIPESSIWLQRSQSSGAWTEQVTGTSIASSPVVLGLTEDAATRLGWPDEQLTWAQVFDADLTMGLPDPGTEPAGVSALLGLQQLASTAPNPGQAVTSLLRQLSRNTEAEMNDMFARLPGTTASAGPIDGFPTSEHAVLQHNVEHTRAQLVSVYAEPGVPSLDYPFVVLPGTRPKAREAAAKFLDLLQNQETSDTLADAGFRTPDGEMLRDRSTDGRTTNEKVTPAQLPDAATVDQLLNQWAGVNLSGRVQVLLDVSGSMNEAVPGADLTRMQITLEAAELGIGLMRPTTKLGIWLFSTNLDGQNRDYRELLPVQPISEHVAAGNLEKLRTVQALPNGATGLYDSTLAAYQAARQNFEPGRINTVVVLTDGRNEDNNGITRDQLLAELAALQDPQRPIRIVGIGIGPDIDVEELDAIAGATGGEAFTTPDPTKIADIFHAALSLLLCQPPSCDPTEGN